MQTTAPRRSPGLRSLRPYLLPVAAGVVLIVAVVLLALRMASVTSFSSTYSGEGRFEVERCTTEARLGGTTITCTGLLVPAGDPQPISTELVGPAAGFGSAAPAAGEAVDAYYEVGNTSRAFPVEARSVEFARSLASVVPLVLIVGGLLGWMVGWIVTRNVHPVVAERYAEQTSWPARFELRPRGLRWMVVGFVWFLIDRWVVDGLLGTVGLI